MEFRNILNLLGNNENARNLIRNLEKTKKKLINSQCAVIFNQTCINESLLPNYTNTRPHDEAARMRPDRFRMERVQGELHDAKQKVSAAMERIEFIINELTTYIDENTWRECETILEDIFANHRRTEETKILHKLNKLYHGSVLLKEDTDKFVNLSKHVLSQSEKEFLNLGTNCHISSGFNAFTKKVELEVLYESLLKLQNNGVVTLEPGLRDQLRAEASKKRSGGKCKILTPELRDAAEGLRNNPDIIIRKADKSRSFVILNKNDYKEKLDVILNDTEKFTRITKNPTLSVKVNSIIDKINKKAKDTVLRKIFGEYHPGYIYGTVKTHKNGNPLRPIISQIPTPTHQVAKQLNKIISPYIPSKYILKSTDDFLTLIRDSAPEGVLASLDVESLFTNVPVGTTIDIVCDYMYRGQDTVPPNIDEKYMRELLVACTTEAPFRHIDGTMYRQVDGVAMGSALSVTLSNFYMAHIENLVLSNDSLKPKIYARYVDDCYLVARDAAHVEEIRQAFEEASVLKFTKEMSINNKINFLDVAVDGSGERYVTTVYRKPTNSGAYMNAIGECPSRYKKGMIKALIHRTFKICSNREIFNNEIKILKQLLINNNYTNKEFDNTLKEYLQNVDRAPDNSTTVKHNIYYRNQITDAYKMDETVMKNILRQYVKCNNDNEQLKLIIYYKSRCTANLIIKNSPKLPEMQRVNLVYKYECEDCKLQYYGFTTTTFSRRLTMHLQNGALKVHASHAHDKFISRKYIVNNTKIVRTENDVNRLQILEALYILEYDPQINRQVTGCARTLALLGDTPPNRQVAIADPDTVSPDLVQDGRN